MDVDLVGGNRSFYFPGVPVRYAARVSDREDGSLTGPSARIPASRVTVTAEYLKEGLPAEAGGITLSAAAAHQAAHSFRLPLP